MFRRVLLSLVVLLSFISSAPAEDLPVQPLRIGAILPLHGVLANIGFTIRNGMRLAEQRFGGGRIRLTIADDGFDPKKSAEIAARFAAEERQDALVVFGSAPGFVVAPIAEEAKVPAIVFSIDPRIVTEKRYVMKHWTSIPAEVSEMSSEIQRRNYRRIAAVSSDQGAMPALLAELVKRQPEGVEVVFQQRFNPADRDYGRAIARIVELSPDAVFVGLLPGASVFASDLRHRGGNMDIFAGHNIEIWEDVLSAQGALWNTWFAAPPSLKGSEFAQSYHQIFGEEPLEGADNGYDVVKMLIEGAQSPDLNEYLHRLHDFHGALSNYGATAENDFALRAELKRITPEGFARLHP